MSTPPHDSPRRRATRSACGLALVLALAHGTTGCAHQLTNADLAVGALAVAAVVAVSIVTPSPWSPCATSFSCPTPSWTSDDQVAHPIPPVLSTRPHATAGR
jgi:hypothetical protein